MLIASWIVSLLSFRKSREYLLFLYTLEPKSPTSSNTPLRIKQDIAVPIIQWLKMFFVFQGDVNYTEEVGFDVDLCGQVCEGGLTIPDHVCDAISCNKS